MSRKSREEGYVEEGVERGGVRTKEGHKNEAGCGSHHLPSCPQRRVQVVDRGQVQARSHDAIILESHRRALSTKKEWI